ncbi:hypothetical protein B0H19DRAFT_1382595 [Mycena capillaripes]|nr:hypothetical protein B0H19DRAFT_1382595 [Mycena capillaripes]
MPPPSTMLSILNLASFADIFLQGVLCAQFAHYTNVNKHDSGRMKLFVAGLALLTTLKSIQVLAIMCIQTVTVGQNVAAITHLWHAQWIMNSALPEAVIVFYVQMFFCHRLWRLSHNVYVSFVPMTFFVFALAAASVAAYFFSNLSLSTLWYAIHLGAAMCGDLLQTGSIVFYLLLATSGDNPGKQIFLTAKLFHLSSKRQSAAPGALCAFTNFASVIVTLSLPAVITNRLSGQRVASSVANTFLPKFYVMAAMWTLNSRDDIRSAAANNPATHLDPRTTSGGMSGPETPRHLGAGEVEVETSGPLSTKPLAESKIIQPNLQQSNIHGHGSTHADGIILALKVEDWHKRDLMSRVVPSTPRESASWGLPPSESSSVAHRLPILGEDTTPRRSGGRRSCSWRCKQRRQSKQLSSDTGGRRKRDGAESPVRSGLQWMEIPRCRYSTIIGSRAPRTRSPSMAHRLGARVVPRVMRMIDEVAEGGVGDRARKTNGESRARSLGAALDAGRSSGAPRVDPAAGGADGDAS